MKNTGLLYMFCIGLLLPLKAQITITNAVFPAVGDTLFYAVSNQAGGITITPPGGNQQWDFSNLQPSFTWEQVFQDPGAGSVYGSFPSATMFYRTGIANVEAYLNVSPQEVKILGYSGGSSATLGLDLIPVYNPPIVQSRAPVNFFDINQISLGLLLPFSPDALPGVGQLPVTPDSLRIRVAINRLDVVDAWGALSIPGGVFNVLREKRTEYTETRLDAKAPPLGWLDITDVAIQYLNLSGLGVDTTTTYHFLNDQSKEPIAVCMIDNSGSLVLGVQYKNLNISTGIKTEERVVADLAVFPNPAKDVLQIRASRLGGGNYTVLIYSILGQEVFRKTCAEASGRLEEILDIAGLENGVYVCKISNGSTQTAQALFVKQ